MPQQTKYTFHNVEVPHYCAVCPYLVWDEEKQMPWCSKKGHPVVKCPFAPQ